MTRIPHLPVLAGLALELASCATAPPAPSPVRADGAPRPVCARLFVSPAGEPFRRGEGGPCPLEVWLAAADRNHDGALDLVEFRADAGRFFSTLDVDGDDVLSPEDVQRYESRVLPELLGRVRDASRSPAAWTLAAYTPQVGGGSGGGFGGSGGGGRGGGRRHRDQSGESSGPAAPGASPDGAGRYGLLDEPEPVSGADLNFDGRVTRAEFLTRAAQRFHELDADGLGRLTLEALRTRLAGRSGPGPLGADGRHGRGAQRGGAA